MSLTKEQWMQETGGLPMNLLLRHTQTLPAPRPLNVDIDQLVYWDTETLPIVFRPGAPQPAPIVACTLDSQRGRRVYKPSEFGRLRQSLRSAKGVVTFNGDNFDLKVLAQHLGVPVRSLGIKSVDLLAMIIKATGEWHNLNTLAYVNLAQPKRSLGLKQRSLKQQTLDCHSDVRQLRRLFLLYLQGRLKVPILRSLFTNKAYKAMPFGGQCPVCSDIASINELPTDESEKEFEATLLAGVIGDPNACRELVGIDLSYRCFTCATIFLPDLER